MICFSLKKFCKDLCIIFYSFYTKYMFMTDCLKCAWAVKNEFG